MGIFFVYILKSAVCLAVFYLFYRLLLARETFYRFNRFALLGILLLSCLLPLVEVTVKQESEVRQTMLTLEQLLLLADAADATEGVAEAENSTVTWIQVVLLLYGAGIILFALRNVCSLGQLLLLLRSGRREEMDRYLPGRRGEARLVVHDRGIAPFSWMGYIVISQIDLQENGREILIHELAHIRNRHSWDLLLADVCIFFQWFNPASWLLKQELQNIHEFEADETVIKEGVNAKQYQLLLIKKAVGTRLYSMANSFNHSKLKKRITMMMKEKSSPWARLKYLYVLPVAAVAVTAFARPEVSNKVEEISAVKVNDLAAIVERKVAESVGDTTKPAHVKYVPTEVREELKGTPAFEVVEEMPEFPNGGMSAMMQYFKENMRYPASAKEKGTQGRVVVRFVVDKDGSIKDATILRGMDEELDAEALRLVNNMPKWKPGRQKGEPVAVKYTVPVTFSLGGDDAGSLSTMKNPLYIVDKKEVSPAVMGALDPNKIEHVTILKDKRAVDFYGERAKDGAVLVTLKKENADVSPLHIVGTPKTKIKLPGVVDVFIDKKKTDLSELDVYVDGEKKAWEEVNQADIYGIEVKKNPDGTGSIYITTKKNAGQADKDVMKVEGKVVDEQGEPVIGASILLEGTNRGTVTDLDGNFKLPVPSKDAVLEVSYIGMATAKVKAQPKLTVTLKDE